MTVTAPACATSPSIETGPSAQAVTAPTAASFKVKEGTIPANCTAATIQWEVSSNGGTSWAKVSATNPTATTATLQISPTRTTESGDEFRATLTNGHGKTVSSAALLTVTAPACATSPSIETGPSAQAVTAPTAATFKVKEGTIPANCTAAAIQWEVSSERRRELGQGQRHQPHRHHGDASDQPHEHDRIGR